MIALPLDRVDRDGAASRAAAEGLFALGAGDTALAREKYAEAGEILQKELRGAIKQADKMLLRFLAATQFYKGGHYQRALEVCKKIEVRLLPEGVRRLFPPFFRDVKLRSAPGYLAGIDRSLGNAWKAGEYQRLLDLLKDHPYVLKPGEMAYVRAGVCEELGEWKTAMLFYESALRYSSGGEDVIISWNYTSLRLLGQNRFREASESIHRLVKLHQHPANSITASVVAFRQAESGDANERSERFEEQRCYLDQAWQAYQRLPKSQQSDQFLRRYMAFGLAGAAKAAILLQDRSRANEVLEMVDQLGDVPGSTQRTIEHLRGFLEKNSHAVDNLFDVEAFLKSERDSRRHPLVPSLAS